MLNIFDIGIILLLIMFLIVGFKNGVIREAFALIGIIAVFIFSFVFISAFVPIGITILFSMCPKLLDFIIGNLYLFSRTSNIIFSNVIPLWCS